MATKVDVIISAQDKASKVLKNFGQQASGVLSNITKVAGVTAVGLAAIGTVSLSLAKDAAKALDLERGFLRNFGKDAETNLNVLRNASKNTIADMNLMEASNRAALLGVTDNVEDLAKLMVTARLRGKEMGLSTTQAFDDIVTGIGRGSPLILDNLGIKIPDAFKEMTKNMSEAETTQALLNFAMEDGAKIAEQLGGDTETASDKFEQLGSKLANLKDNIGQALLPVVLSVINTFEEWAKVIEERLQPVLDILKPIIENVVGNIKAIFSGFVSSILGYFNKIKLNVDNLGNNISKKFSKIINIFEKVRDIAEDVFSTIKDAVATALKGVHNAIEKAKPNLEKIFVAFQRIGQVLYDIFIPVIQKVIEVIQFLWENIFKPFIEWLASNAGPVLEEVIRVIAEVVDFIASVLEAFQKSIIPILEEVFAKFVEILTGIFNFAKPILEKLFEIFSFIFNNIKIVIEKAWNIITEIIRVGLDIWDNLIFPVLTMLYKVFSEVFSAIKGVVESAFSFIIDQVIKPALQWFQNNIVPVIETVVNAIKSVFEGLRGPIETVWNSIQNVIKGAINGLIDIVNGFIRGVNQALGTLDRVGQSLGIEIGFRIGEIPRLAQGGSFEVDKPTLIQVGEGGQSEKVEVTPLSQSPRTQQGSGININVNIPLFMADDNSTREVAERIYNELKRIAKSQGTTINNLAI